MSRILRRVSREAYRRVPWRVPVLLALATVLVAFFAGTRRDFWAPDEPDFAEHVREMRERHDLLVPYENGRPYGEKPILYYWAMAATTPLSGGDVAPWALRIPSALAAGFLVFGASALAARRGGRGEALIAGAATASAPLVFWQGQFIQTDALFTALLFGAFLAQERLAEGESRGALWAFHVLLPLAVLTKGPLAVALTGLVALVRCVEGRSLRPVLELKPLRGSLVFVLLVVPWYLLATRAGGPEYAYDLVVNQNWNRFFHAFDHVQPWWFYFESVLGDFFPWTLPAVFGVVSLRRSGLLRRRPELGFCATAAATVFVFLSFSQSKQGKYLLVVFPLAAVLLAAAVRELERRARSGAGGAGLRALRLYTLFVAALLFGASLALVPTARVRAPRFAPLAPWVALPLALGSAGTAVILLRRRREVTRAFLALAATLMAGEAAAAAVVFPAIDLPKTGRPLYQRLAPRVAHGEPLAYFGGTYHCYPILVLRRKTDHVKTPEALVRWLDEHPGGLVLVDESVRRHWTDPRLASLRILDSQRTGGDRALVLAR